MGKINKDSNNRNIHPCIPSSLHSKLPNHQSAKFLRQSRPLLLHCSKLYCAHCFSSSFLVISSNFNNNRRRHEYSVLEIFVEHYFFLLQSDLNRRGPYIHTFPNRKKRSLYPSFWNNMLKWSNRGNFLDFSWKFIILL